MGVSGISGAALATGLSEAREGGDAEDAQFGEVPNAPVGDQGSRQISVKFDSAKCIHARFCVLWAPAVFRPGEHPWLNPAGDSDENIAAVIRNCPSGALSYERRDGKQQEKAPPVNLVTLRENGPLAFRGRLSINGVPIGYRATLCRCGASANKPLCDGSHIRSKFNATGEVAPVESEKLQDRAGDLAIEPIQDGPLQVVGNMEICVGTGHTIKLSQKETLCRCGHSQSKPFCDGSHATFGFKSST